MAFLILIREWKGNVTIAWKERESKFVVSTNDYYKVEEPGSEVTTLQKEDGTKKYTHSELIFPSEPVWGLIISIDMGD